MNVLLIYGGKSCEHDISIITACLAKGYFAAYEIYCAYIDRDNRCYLADTSLSPFSHKNFKKDKPLIFLSGEKSVAVLKRNKIVKRIVVDCAVNCCHGINGEDGTVSGLLNSALIPSAESGIIPSALGMDKWLTKCVLKGMKLPVLKGFLVDKRNYDDKICLSKAKKLGFPVIAKPVSLGSSIGIKVAKTFEELGEALNAAFQFDNRVLIEKALTDFYEVNCSAMRIDGKIETGEIFVPVTANEILTFKDKYVSGEKGFAPKSAQSVPEEIAALAAKYTKRIYREWNNSGVVRADFICDRKSGTLYVNEINTVPGSLAYNMWSKKYTPTAFGKILAKEALVNYDEESLLQYRFDSAVLDKLKGIKK